MAAFQICLQVWMTSSLLAFGLGGGGQAIIACALAEKDYQKAASAASRVLQVGSSYRAKDVDYALESIHNIREAFPELWETLEKTEGVRYSLSCSKAASSWGLCDLLWSDLIGVRAAKKKALFLRHGCSKGNSVVRFRDNWAGFLYNRFLKGNF